MLRPPNKDWSDSCPVDVVIVATVGRCDSTGGSSEEEVDVVLGVKALDSSTVNLGGFKDDQPLSSRQEGGPLAKAKTENRSLIFIIPGILLKKMQISIWTLFNYYATLFSLRRIPDS